jgi:hypothetical protein
VTVDAPSPFTPDRATAALALIRPIVIDVRSAYLELRKHLVRHGRAGTAALIADDEDVPDDVRARLEGFGEHLAELQALGVRLEDPELGLVALPGLRDGQAVTFCWKLGEERVRYWYPDGGSYTDRRPI